MSLVSALKREFEPRRLLPSITAGLVVGLIDISVELSLAALIFSGNLSRFLARGIGLMLFGAVVMGIVTALATSVPGLIAIPQDTPAAIMALIAAGIVGVMKLASPDALYATVLAAIAVTSLLTGLVFLLLGRFKASGFVRYIPYPVVNGFLAGTGWLLATGGLGVMVSLPATLAGVPQLFAPGVLFRWAPGFLFAVALFFVLRRWNHYLITPAALVVATALFYGYLLLARIPLAEALANGWLIGAFPAGGMYQPPTAAALAQIDWHAIWIQSSQIASIIVLSAVALLLNASALEVTFHQDINLNREVMTAGYINLAAGIVGSPVGYQALSMSALAHRLGARSRMVNLTISLLCGLTLLFGGSLISYLPKFLLGGMTLYLGLVFLWERLIDSARSLPVIDYVLVWLILIVIAAVGFLQGIGVGILIAAGMFVVSYSRVNTVRNVLNGEVFRSNVDRPKVHRELLAKRGAEIYILRLQGFIFFGTIQSILEKVQARLTDTSQPKMCYLVLDFQRVTRLDSSAVFGVTRLRQLAMANDVSMVWTHVAPGIESQLRRGGLIDEGDESFLLLPTLDHGVEWCENKILAGQGITDLTGFIERMQGLLRKAFPGLQDVNRMMKYLERQEVAQGEYLMHEGDAGSEMYFVEAGLFSVQLESPDHKVVRLRAIRGGATIGEVGLYLGTPRSASVVATRPSAVYKLSADALTAMRTEDPEAAALLHEWIARLLAERLTENNRTIQALMD
ncbi:MAG TPA: SulP family inorganic anion transporter [Anaerolineales bacterium]